MSEITNALKIAVDYEVDFGSVVGTNDFSYGHEAGQIFAAERIAELIRYHEAEAPSVALLRRLREVVATGAAGTEVIEEVDTYLSGIGAPASPA